MPVSLVHSAPDGIQSTPVSTVQAEQMQRSAVNLGISEKSLAKATSALKTKLLNQAISQLQAEQKEKVVDLVDIHGCNTELNHDLQNAKTDPEKLKVLMNELEEYQEAKKDVARASNKAGAMKATKLLQGFNSDFQELQGTTDIAGFGFFVWGSFESSIKSTIVGSGPVLEFFQKCFNKDPWEMACLFEVFVTTYNKVGGCKLLHSEKAKATSKIISESLDVSLVSPRDITDPLKLNTLYDAWKSGSAYWSTMDEREYKRFMQQLDNDKAAGLQIKIPQKGQSDIGGMHQKAITKHS
ncbi:hypothetical protein EV368DRAFT_66392 [Lentinula lateritia]|nr:hypothetical protein EV368DRAFT_66392 [Lentinula lateritia]